jgi:hypothetical protein
VLLLEELPEEPAEALLPLPLLPVEALLPLPFPFPFPLLPLDALLLLEELPEEPDEALLLLPLLPAEALLLFPFPLLPLDALLLEELPEEPAEALLPLPLLPAEALLPLPFPFPLLVVPVAAAVVDVLPPDSTEALAALDTPVDEALAEPLDFTGEACADSTMPPSKAAPTHRPALLFTPMAPPHSRLKQPVIPCLMLMIRAIAPGTVTPLSTIKSRGSASGSGACEFSRVIQLPVALDKLKARRCAPANRSAS